MTMVKTMVKIMSQTRVATMVEIMVNIVTMTMVKSMDWTTFDSPPSLICC